MTYCITFLLIISKHCYFSFGLFIWGMINDTLGNTLDPTLDTICPQVPLHLQIWAPGFQVLFFRSWNHKIPYKSFRVNVYSINLENFSHRKYKICCSLTYFYFLWWLFTPHQTYYSCYLKDKSVVHYRRNVSWPST